MATNKVNLVGRLGKDPDFHYIDKNTTTYNISNNYFTYFT